MKNNKQALASCMHTHDAVMNFKKHYCVVPSVGMDNKGNGLYGLAVLCKSLLPANSKPIVATVFSFN